MASYAHTPSGLPTPGLPTPGGPPGEPRGRPLAPPARPRRAPGTPPPRGEVAPDRPLGELTGCLPVGVRAAAPGTHGTPRVPISPSISRLDRVLDLVMEHEAHYREQDLKMADMVKKVADMDDRMTREFQRLKELDIQREMEHAKIAIGQIHKQVKLVGQEVEAMRRDHAGAKQAVAGMQGQMQKLALDFEEYKAATEGRLQEALETHKAAVDDMADRVATQMGALETAAAEGRKNAEGFQDWVKKELGELAEKVATTTDKETETERKLLEQKLEQQKIVEVAFGRLDALSAERDKMRKRFNKVESSSSLQGSVAKLKTENVQLQAQLNALQSQYESVSRENHKQAARIGDTQQQLDEVEQKMVDKSKDLSTLAENFGSYLHQQQRQPVSPIHPYYGQPASYVNQPIPMGGFGGGLGMQTQSPVFTGVSRDDSLQQFDEFLKKLKRRVREAERMARENRRERRSWGSGAGEKGLSIESEVEGGDRERD